MCVESLYSLWHDVRFKAGVCNQYEGESGHVRVCEGHRELKSVFAMIVGCVCSWEMEVL